MAENPLLQAYSAGAVGFNTQPFLNHYLNLQAKKEARNQALDKYYTDQMNAVTPTGMRTKDIQGGWGQKFKEWQDLGIRNKKFLLNPGADNYQTLSKFNQLGAELKQGIELSKTERDKHDWLGKAKAEGKLTPTQSDYDMIDASSYSIYDPNFKELDLSKLSSNRPPLDFNKFITGQQSLYKRGKQPYQPDVIDDKQGLRTTYTHEVFSPDDLKSMAQRAAFDVEGKGQYSADWDAFDRVLHSKDLPQLQAVYSKYFPQSGMISTPAQAAAAYTLLNSEGGTNKSTTTGAFESPQSKRNWDLYMEGVRQKNRERLKSMKGAGEGGEGDAYDIVDVLFQDAKNNPRTYKTADGKTSVQYEASVSPEIEKMFAFKDGDKEIKPDAYRFSQDGKYFTPIFYKYKDGEPVKGENGMVAVDEKISRPILTDLLRANQGKKNFGTKENKAIMAASKNKAKSVKPTKGMFD